MDIGTIICGIISLVSLIVFFVMAWNVGKVHSELKDIKLIFMAVAEDKDLVSNLECPNCNKVIKTVQTEGQIICPKCNTSLNVLDFEDNEEEKEK